MLAGDVEHVAGRRSPMSWSTRVELLRLGEVREVAGVEQEGRRSGSALTWSIAACSVPATSVLAVLVEADVAVADLHEGEAVRRRRPAAVADQLRARHAAATVQTTPVPTQAMHFEQAAAVDAIRHVAHSTGRDFGRRVQYRRGERIIPGRARPVQAPRE